METFNAPGMTKWTNPLGKPKVKLHLYKYPPIIHPHKVDGMPGTVKDNGFLDVEIPPGESVWLASSLDNAIQRYDENGVVMSGECPWLIKNDGARPEVHPSLDPVEQQRIQAEADAERARIKANEAEAEKFKAQQQIAEAERLKKEAEDRAAADKAARDKFESERAALEAERAEFEKQKAELAKQKAEAEKALEEATKPASGSGGDSGAGGKRGGSKTAG